MRPTRRTASFCLVFILCLPLLLVPWISPDALHADALPVSGTAKSRSSPGPSCPPLLERIGQQRCPGSGSPGKRSVQDRTGTTDGPPPIRFFLPEPPPPPALLSRPRAPEGLSRRIEEIQKAFEGSNIRSMDVFRTKDGGLTGSVGLRSLLTVSVLFVMILLLIVELHGRAIKNLPHSRKRGPQNRHGKGEGLRF